MRGGGLKEEERKGEENWEWIGGEELKMRRREYAGAVGKVEGLGRSKVFGWEWPHLRFRTMMFQQPGEPLKSGHHDGTCTHLGNIARPYGLFSD